MKGKRELFLVVLTVAVLVIIFSVTAGVIKRTDGMMTDYCFKELDRAASSLAAELKYIMDSDGVTLKSMARLISSQADITDASTLEIMNSIASDSAYINSVELLTPDGTLMNEAGAAVSAAGFLDFEEESKKGAYISGKEVSPFDGEMIMRSGAPIMKNGVCAGVLYGIVRLKRLADIYKTDIYDGSAYVYLLDSDTGDFLLDTWHKSLGNIYDMGARKTMEGYSFEEFARNVKELKSGNIGFVSRTTGGILYMRNQPLNVNRLSVLITVDESVALREMRSISQNLYGMAAFDAGIMLAYMAVIVACVFLSYRAARRLGMEDLSTGLQNRIAYDKLVNETQGRLFGVIACVYVDANGLHEINNRFGHDAGDQMLTTIALALKQSFPPKNVYRIGGDEFVALVEDMSITECERRAAEAEALIAAHEYAVSMGLSWRENEIGMNRVIQEADERMLANKREYYKTHDRRSNRAYE